MQVCKHRLGITWVMLMALWLSACSTQQPVPVNKYYHFPAPSDVARVSDKPAGVLLVERPIANGIYNERSILFTEADMPLEVQRHHYYFWSQSPSYMIREFALDYLRQTGLYDEVVDSSADLRPDARLSMNIERFERVLSPKGDEVWVRLDVRFSSKAKQWQRTIKSRQKVSGSGTHAAVEAFGIAMTHIMQEIVQTLR
jgi:ABC-type uncharacterized transport system auxiliary subunit